MKQPANIQKLEEVLRSSNSAGAGFMGTDRRNISEIIDGDIVELAELKIAVEQIVGRMKEITDAAVPALGCWVQAGRKLEAKAEEVKGQVSCPWPDSAKFAKRVTYVRNPESGQSMKWSDLNIHLIEKHNFFEGRGAMFRIEPKELVKMLFERSAEK
ncbi:MAG: hypothetical protein PHY02_08055 [Phycisphaerae bacterium]|nr:hypothetical protein [Phycisphaerae bacterium]